MAHRIAVPFARVPRARRRTGRSARRRTAEAAGKDFVIGFLGDATSLNPVIATDGQSYIAEWPIYDSLVELDEKLGVKPLLAESWEVSRDGLTYTFKLKKGVKWHDGKPFTARDVAFTFYSVLDPKVTTPHRGYFDALVGFPELTNKDNPKKPEELAQKPIEVLDDYTIRFRLRYPYGAFLAVLVNPRAGIVPEHVLKGQDLNTTEFNRKPIGTGPFKFVEWKRGERIVLEANPDYHGGRPGPRPADLPGDPGQRRAAPGAPRRRRRLHRAAAADRGGAAQADGRAQGHHRRQHLVHVLRLPPGRGAVRRRPRPPRAVSRHRHPGDRPRGAPGLRRRRPTGSSRPAAGRSIPRSSPTRTIRTGPRRSSPRPAGSPAPTASSPRTASACPSRSGTTRRTRP